MAYECSCCGDRHDGLAMGYRLERPGLDSSEDAFEFSREGELCIAGSHYFILANLGLPYKDVEEFVWTCWISLSDASFRRIDNRWEAEDREDDEPAFGWFSNDLPTYNPTTWALKARVHQRPVGERPWIELEPTDHPLAIEQREGISDERMSAIYHAFSEPSK
jgi:hypothetical protein